MRPGNNSLSSQIRLPPPGFRGDNPFCNPTNGQAFPLLPVPDNRDEERKKLGPNSTIQNSGKADFLVELKHPAPGIQNQNGNFIQQRDINPTPKHSQVSSQHSNAYRNRNPPNSYDYEPILGNRYPSQNSNYYPNEPVHFQQPNPPMFSPRPRDFHPSFVFQGNNAERNYSGNGALTPVNNGPPITQSQNPFHGCDGNYTVHNYPDRGIPGNTPQLQPPTLFSINVGNPPSERQLYNDTNPTQPGTFTEWRGHNSVPGNNYYGPPPNRNPPLIRHDNNTDRPSNSFYNEPLKSFSEASSKRISKIPPRFQKKILHNSAPDTRISTPLPAKIVEIKDISDPPSPSPRVCPPYSRESQSSAESEVSLYMPTTTREQTPFENWDSSKYEIEGRHYNSQGGVLIYIDNSNIWINTMKKSAKILRFRNNIKQDARVRVDVMKLMTTASAGKPIIRAVLYGSEPPPIDKFWNRLRNCKFCKVDVQVTKRSTFSNREKEVDQNIMLDIGEDIVIHHEHANCGGTVILFTGDGGMIAAVRRALRYNWDVEVWAYRNSIAQDYLEEAKTNSKLTIKYLDDVFSDLVFYNLNWKTDIPIPPERSLVVTLANLPEPRMTEVEETVIKTITQLVKMPVAGQYLGYRKGEKATETHLAVVIIVGLDILMEDSRSDQQENKNQLKKKISSETEKKKPSFSFPSEQWEIFANAFNLEEGNEKIKSEAERIIHQTLNKQPTIPEEMPKYDFNKEFYNKVEQVLIKGVDDEDIPQELKAEWTVLQNRYKPRIRSVPQFYQDTKHLFLSNFVLESPAIDDDGEGGFTVQTGRRGYKNFHKYSQMCRHSFRCSNGFKCAYSHSKMEKEFFKLQPDVRLRWAYKREECKREECKWPGRSYMCSYAHGYFCIICKCDEEGGHNLSKCPAPPPPSEDYNTAFPTPPM